MGSESSNSNKKKHIYDELNKTIDSFTSCDDFNHSEDEIKPRKNKLHKSKRKFGLKKRKKITKELNKELIESSLLISDFLINNIINPNKNKRPLPDSNMLNSLLIIPDPENIEELKIENQIDFCEQILNNGINDYKNEYKKYRMNKKEESKNKDNILLDYSYKNASNERNILINDNSKIQKDINKTEIDIYNKNSSPFPKNTYDKNSNDNLNNNDNNNHSFANYLYKPKQIKFFNKTKKNSKEKENNEEYINYLRNNKEINHPKNYSNFNINPKNNIHTSNIKEKSPFISKNYSNINNSNKIKIKSNKPQYIRKKIYIPNSPKITEFKSKDKEKIINLSNIVKNKKYMNDINNTKIILDNNKNSSRNIIYLKNKNDLSMDNINNKSKNNNYKKNLIDKKNLEQEKKRRKSEDNFAINNTQNLIYKKDNFNDINIIEKSYNFNIMNKDNNININQNKNSENIIENSAKINKNKEKNESKTSLFNINNNIALESEYRKSKIYLNEEKNNNEKIFNNINKSSLKEFVNKQAKNIKQSPDYINNKKKEKKKDISEYNFENNNNYYKINNNSQVNNDSNYLRYNFNNLLNKTNNKSTSNKTKSKTKKNKNKSNIITINLKDVLSKEKNKK